MFMQIITVKHLNVTNMDLRTGFYNGLAKIIK